MCIGGACKTALGCALVFYKCYGRVRAGSLQLTPEACVKRPLMREPRAQADAAGFALCPETSRFSGEVREGSHAVDVLLDPWYRSR